MKGQNRLANGGIFVFCFGVLASTPTVDANTIAAPRPKALSSQVSSEPADRR